MNTQRLPVLFVSHGSPFDIAKNPAEHPYWARLRELGDSLRSRYTIQSIVVFSAHWVTRGTWVDNSEAPRQIYDYSGFPPDCYTPVYRPPGNPALAEQIVQMLPGARLEARGLDHGSWPMLMHLFPQGDVPVLQVSLNLGFQPQDYYQLGQQLQSLREQGVLLIGSGALIHNLERAFQGMRSKTTDRAWESEFDQWIAERILAADTNSLFSYDTSHPLGSLAAPTPEHFVPMLIAMGALEPQDCLDFFYTAPSALPAFSERSFIAGAPA